MFKGCFFGRWLPERFEEIAGGEADEEKGDGREGQTNQGGRPLGYGLRGRCRGVGGSRGEAHGLTSADYDALGLRGGGDAEERLPSVCDHRGRDGRMPTPLGVELLDEDVAKAVATHPRPKEG